MSTIDCDNPPFGNTPRQDAIPLSFAQQRLWFTDQLEPGVAAYNIPLAMRLTGPLDPDALRRALGEIVRRHEVLRTVIRAVEGQPVQHVLPEAEFDLPTIDLWAGRRRPDAAAAQSGNETTLRRLLCQEVRRPFDLGRDLMLRARLFRLDDQQHVLVLVMHHIASDGWSVGVLLRELGILYGAFACGRPSPLDELPVQYADYAIWQRQWLEGSELARQLAYWRRQLEGAPPVLELPADHPRPAVETFRGASHTLAIPLALCEKLKALGSQERVTLFTVLLAAFNVLLHRYTGQNDLVVGSPVAGRRCVETEGLIGFFVNSLVLRTDLSGRPTFRELLGRVQATALYACEHQDLPFERLVEELQPARDLSRNPLFQVMFALQNVPRHPLRLAGLDVQPMEVSTGSAKCDLTVTVSEVESGLEASFSYNTDLFEAATIRRMAGHWLTLLRSAAEDPDRHVGDLPLLTGAERHEMLVEWNRTARPYPREAGLAELFEAQARRTPRAVAVACDGQRLSYRELNARANRLARHLRSLGVQRGTLVGICMRRSIEMIVGILGIVKAGGAYVPLDADYPQERLAMMLADAACPVLLTQSDLADRLPDPRTTGVRSTGVSPVSGKERLEASATFGEHRLEASATFGEHRLEACATEQRQTVRLDRDWPVIARSAAGDLPAAATGGDLAYVIYTSGSTGRPKGTAVPQRAVSRLVLESNYVQLTPADVVAQASNCSFDAATFEIWGALLSGARLEIVAQETLVSPRALKAKIRRAGITTLFVTTALFNQLVEQDPGAFARLRHLLFGGEASSPAHVRKLLRGRPPKRLLHVYGPTETTTFATWHLVREVADDAATIPIGRPIANTRVYLLDEAMQPVPVGIPGEIYIGGDGVACGYLNRPELTAERFVPDPFSDDRQSRLYKTGDLARYLPDGTIEFLARTDQQVKLRGFRIEPGEIEAALGRHPAVGRAVVTVREDTPGDKRLVAYVVPAQQSAPTQTELRNFLRQTLPDYMIPAAFVTLDSLPLTPNGKLDRRALPPPDRTRRGAEAAHTPPHTPTEHRLARIWADVLKLDRVGTSDNFFELGGHSLLAVRVFARIEKAFAKSLPLATLFKAPTLGELARVLDEGPAPRRQSPLVPIRAEGSRPPFYFIHGGDGHVLKFHTVAGLLGADQPLYALEAVGTDGTQLPLRRVEDMAAAYLREVRALQPEGPYSFGGYSFGGLVALEMAQQVIAQGDEVGLLVLFDTSHPQVRRPATLRRNAITQLPRRIRRPVQRALCWAIYRMCLRAGRPVPAFVRNFSIRDADRRAIRCYTPRPYPGRMTYFRAAEDLGSRSLDRWREVALGGLEVHCVPGSHREMFKGVNAQRLAAELRACLDRASTPALRKAA